jgi:hypothetical protein
MGDICEKTQRVKWKRDSRWNSRLSLNKTYTGIEKLVTMRNSELKQHRVHAKLPRRSVANPVVAATTRMSSMQKGSNTSDL